MTQSQPNGDSASIEGYARPAVTVDVLLFTVRDEKLQLALIKRGIEPYRGSWALPGGFVRMDEELEEAARREIEEETGVRDVFLEQLYTFGQLNRDPRTRVITISYFALVPGEHLTLRADTDASDASWFAIDELPDLAFDHAAIVRVGLERLKGKIENSNVAYGLLPARFRLSELQRVYEIILGRALDKRNFRKRVLALGIVEATDKYSSGGAHRPAQLFRWKKRKPKAF